MPRLSLPTLTVLLALLALSGCDGFSPAAEEPGPVISAAPAPSKAMIGPGSCEGDGQGDDDGGGDGGSSYDGPVYGGGGGDDPDDPLLAGAGGGVAPPDAQVASCDSGGGGGYTGGGGSTGDGGDDSGETAEQAAWGKALKIGRRIKTAVDRGEDLSDVNTWKRIANDEWGDLVDCGMGIHSVAQGDMLGLIDVLNCASSQLLGVDFGDMLRGLRYSSDIPFIERWTQPMYDAVLRALRNSGIGGVFGNGIGNIDLLYDYARLSPASGTNSSRVYEMLNSCINDVAESISSYYGRDFSLNNPQIMRLYNQDGTLATTIIKRISTTTGLPTLEFQGRFGASTTKREVRLGNC